MRRLRVTIATDWTGRQLAHNLRPFLEPGGPWTGTVSDDGFRMSRRMNTRHLFVPVVSGRVADGALAVRIELPTIVTVVMAIWMVMAIVGSALAVALVSRGGSPVSLLAFVFPAAALALWKLVYGHEARLAERWLRRFVPPPG